MGDLGSERFPPFDSDPRLGLSDEALDAASRNAFPVVATDARRRDRAGLLIGAAMALGLGMVTFIGLTRTDPARAPTPSGLAVPAQSDADRSGKTRPAAPVATAPLTAPLAAPAAILAQPPSTMAKLQPGLSPVMVYDMSADAGPATHAPGAEPGTRPATPGATGLNDNEAFGSRVGGVGVETASASRLVDPTNTVTQGTLIPAILETAIDSDLPGFVRAVVSQDVRSFDGKRVLIPRSSRLIGQYKSGLAAGQTRAYVIWTRLIRPDGASVPLASPAVEFSGRSGLSGEVENHFFQRFGAASLLSVIGGLGALASSGAGLLIASSGQSAAAVAAQRDSQIPPTIRIAQGQPVRVFTARDLDFSQVAP